MSERDSSSDVCSSDLIGAIAAGERGGHLEMVLAAIDVMHRQLTRCARIARRGVGHPAGLEHRRSEERRGGKGGVALRAGEGYVDSGGRRAAKLRQALG